MIRSILRLGYLWTSQFVDPFRFARAVRNFPLFLADYRAYRKLPGAERLRLRDLEPTLHERSGSHEFDTHYFYLNAWAMRRVTAALPRLHVDIASQTAFATALSATVPVFYLDYRPLAVHLSGLRSMAANATALPLATGSVMSLSCLHVAEHIGLGRYGDPLDPQGTFHAVNELVRVIAPGGELLFALPVGRERVCFNAHRVFRASTIAEAFAELELVEFSGVGDDAVFVENVALDRFDSHRYACGMFRFRKTRS
jgi:hypothetical protein